MQIKDRYASATRSSNLQSHPDTRFSDSDVLGAYGIADRRLSSGQDHFDKHPLSVPLERLFTGDNSATGEIMRILTDIICGKATGLRIVVKPVQAKDMARVILGWFRHPACQVCGGHGYKIIPGTLTLSDAQCPSCSGTGKVQLERAFRPEQRELVSWVIALMERESSRAGPEAMKAISLEW